MPENIDLHSLRMNGSFFYEDEANSYHYPTAQSRVQITGE